MNKYCWFIIFLIFLSCKQNSSIKIANNEVFKIERDISYGKNSEEKFDIYFPENSKIPKKVFILIHGGSWKGGEKSDFELFMFSLMQKFPDYAFVNMNYVLADEAHYAIPTQTQNIASVINFLKINSKKYNLRNEYILAGYSAGAHLAMLYDYLLDEKNEVKSVINIVGPTNLSDQNFKSYLDYDFVEKHLVDPKYNLKNLNKIKLASPITWVSEKSSPTISFYGNSDNIIPSTQKKSLDSVLNFHKIKNESYEFSGSHNDWQNEKNEKFLVEKIEAFIKNSN